MWILIIFWIIFGLICYKLAEDKNRDKNLAFWMGVLFGFFAVIYYFCVKGGILCPKCRERISKDAELCPYCRTELKSK